MRWAKGKWALAVCDRCGLTGPYLNMVSEPGTGWRVHRHCSDGKWNILDHPQNGPFPVAGEAIFLRHPRPELPAFTTVGTSVSVWLSLVPFGEWE